MTPHWAADTCGARVMDTGEVASAATVTDRASPSSPVPALPTRSAKSVYRPNHTAAPSANR